jgi:hypothetical protein
MAKAPPKPSTTPEPKPRTAPDVGYYPMMHPYPGFTSCPRCGSLLAWDAARGQRVSAVFGHEHRCHERS